MTKGNIIRIQINRAKYRLSATKSKYGNILCGTVIKVHTYKVSVKMLDIWGSKNIHYLTIDREEVLKVL